MLYTTLLASAFVACSGDKGEDSQPSVTTTDSQTNTTIVDQCEPPGASECDNFASVIRGIVSVDKSLGLGNLSGDLMVILTRYRQGSGELGGLKHIHTRVPDVDLGKGSVPFEIDMCDGYEMWSEDNCEYNLLIMLDTNGDATAEAYLPDIGSEPATRLGPFELSCQADSPCYDDIVLDCVDGVDCFKFSNPADNCDCGESCRSEAVTCG